MIPWRERQRVSLREAAEIRGMSVSWFRKAVAAGTIPSEKEGGRVLVPVRWLLAFEEEPLPARPQASPKVKAAVDKILQDLV